MTNPKPLLPIGKLPFWLRVRLLFVRREVYWDNEEKMVTIIKRHRGMTHILHQEPIAYGDARNHQLSRLGL